MRRRLKYGLLLIASVGLISLTGCSWLGSSDPSAEEGSSSGKGMVCIYRLSSPDEYGAESKAEVKLNEKVVCTLVPGEYWSGLCDAGEISVEVFVDYVNLEGNKAFSNPTNSFDVQANQSLFLRVRGPSRRDSQTKRRRGPVIGKAAEIKECVCDGREFSRVENPPEGNSVIYMYRLSPPDERGPEYPSVIYLNDKLACTLRPSEYCVHFSAASQIGLNTTLHRQPLVDDGIPTVISGGGCSADGSPSVSLSLPPRAPGGEILIRVIYPKDWGPEPKHLLEQGSLEEMTSCQRVEGR